MFSKRTLKVLRNFNSQVIQSRQVPKYFNSSPKLQMDSFLNGTNANYLDQMFDKWHEDHNSVPSSWNAYFHNMVRELPTEDAFQLPPKETFQGNLQAEGTSGKLNVENEFLKIRMLLAQYHYTGHYEAKVDPLNLPRELYLHDGVIKQVDECVQRLELDYYGFTEDQINKEYSIYDEKIGGFCQSQEKIKLKDLITKLRKVYCDKVGYEFMHLDNRDERNWLLNRIEVENPLTLSKEEKIKIFERLAESYDFTEFLKIKFPTAKRFGIEGCDTLISGLQKISDEASNDFVDHVVYGMAHRGRLNTLAFVLKKPVEEILAEIQELKSEQSQINLEDWGNSGDVKYHLGTTSDSTYPNGHTMRQSILPNPSHLETVNPVVYGKTRAIQDFTNDQERLKAFGVIIHGDAANSGQGVVSESMQFQDLHKYTTGGIIHIVVNNQIGFTTTPSQQRSGYYCTDVAKSIGSPVFHVNADEPEAVDSIMKLAFAYRQQFRKDVVIDLIGYRRMGHNEMDQPSFTQPHMYKKVNQMKDVFFKFRDEMLAQGVIDQAYVDATHANYLKKFEEGFTRSVNQSFNRAQWQPKQYEEIRQPDRWGVVKHTGIPLDELKEIGLTINNINKEGFTPHSLIKKIYQARTKSIQDGVGIDFATAEALAFATLLKEGYGVRLSGQDVERGTFSHRHSVLNDQERNYQFRPIDNLQDEGSDNKFIVSNSNLSEYGVMGFEYGYSISNPNFLVMWEAQFGDFANVAQIMIDNMVISGESKWGVQTGLTLLLPHGMDGQGPEHSSARLERFLQLSDDCLFSLANKDKDGRYRAQNEKINLQVCVPTTAANYFHMLRRQMRRLFRKPLVSFNSKQQLRLKAACSKLEDFGGENNRFRWIYNETQQDWVLPDDQIKRVVFCSGQVYYSILDKRTQLQSKDTVIIRIEQLSPFPYDLIQNQMIRYTNAQFLWVQEEHQNQGAWSYVRQKFGLIFQLMKEENNWTNCLNIKYVGRKASSSSATGSGNTHKRELELFLAQTFQ